MSCSAKASFKLSESTLFQKMVQHFEKVMHCDNVYILCMLGNFSCICCRLWTIFKINLLKNILPGTLSEYCMHVKRFGSRSGSKLFAKVISR